MKAIELQNIPSKGYFFKDFGEILQGKCKTDRLEVSNAWSGSKLLINEDIPEIQDFMSKLPTNEQKEKPTQSAKSLSNWSGGSQYSPNGEDDPMVYPDELEMLLNKKMAFRVKVQPTFSQAFVWKLCDDEAFVKEIENDYIVEDNQSKIEYAKLVPNKENLETSAQTLSASGENDPESIILMTPAKDVVIADKGEEVDFEASGATQLSGTKPSKKLKIEPSS
ncbi:hypothetical protein KIW84_043165 [Lathyrus oleraceus]|uniref:Uncharacterized protein n=1 Tax=Pisum sativum TaxID=3888 RepID=A0A9D4XD61_PEA|nr:hypothetical protein KIW84_043165 [Pisum sativum]